MRLLVESESLLNDGVAAVLFALVVAWAAVEGASSAPVRVFSALAVSAGGGTLVGLLCGGAAIIVAGRTSDHLVETALTTVAAYGSFLLAEYLHLSGVLATVAAGLLMGNFGVLGSPPEGQFRREVARLSWRFGNSPPLSRTR